MKWLKLTRVAGLVIVALSLMAATVLAGTVPNTLNYQGTLTDSTGKPVTATAKPVTFKLYTSALGGTAFWTESQSVPVTNGQFSAVLGSNISLPTENFTGNTYIGITVDAGPEMLPRQKMTSVAYALKAADGIPKGVIVMWSGAVVQIPVGWALCDGGNGTPNLRDRFVVGAGGGYAVSGTGGSSTVDASHTHPIAAESPGTTATGDHGHHIDVNFYNGIGDTTDGAGDGSKDVGSESHGHHLTADTGGGGYHAHTVNAHNHQGVTGAGGSSIAALGILPPYYALAFIMKL